MTNTMRRRLLAVRQQIVENGNEPVDCSCPLCSEAVAAATLSEHRENVLERPAIDRDVIAIAATQQRIRQIDATMTLLTTPTPTPTIH